jgi:restriction system protein
MAIPDYQTMMLPLLKLAADEKEHFIHNAIDQLVRVFNLSEQERKELLPSGQQMIFDNRVGWARTYLKKAGLLESTKRGFFKITTAGLEALKQQPNEINVDFLKRYPGFVEFKETYKKDERETLDNTHTPEESLEYAYQRIKQDLAQELLNRIKSCSPEFFEKLVIELLLKMGYGGTIKDAGKAIGMSGDGGIDGIIKEDRLGLDIIYVQAKRWEGSVGRPEIQKFAGALQGQRAKKGIFITTSFFSNDAKEYVSKIDNKIIIMDGEQLTQLMIDYNVGVSKTAEYEIKKIDSDYFENE